MTPFVNPQGQKMELQIGVLASAPKDEASEFSQNENQRWHSQGKHDNVPLALRSLTAPHSFSQA
jgi:hypothetical protein